MKQYEGLGLDGRVAVVTGAARGIGRATVELLLAEGAQVVACDIRPEVRDWVDPRVQVVVGDVADEASARRAVQTAVDHFGTLDILVNNAGRTLNAPAVETTADDWDDIMRVNARGTFLHCREALRVMVPLGRGSIVNLASVVSVVGMPQTAAYAASKGAIAQLTKVLALEHGAQGIRVNAVAPGVVETDILEGIVPDSRATLASYGSAHPLGRVASPHEIAEVVAWAASPRSSFVTGAVLLADGGYTAI
jgi:NAD(P)-dependent dehydrogenase (short-subunit alcohol dehydrogenase family)